MVQHKIKTVQTKNNKHGRSVFVFVSPLYLDNSVQQILMVLDFFAGVILGSKKMWANVKVDEEFG